MTSRAHSIVGVSEGRPEDDFYPTPAYAVEALLKREHFEGTVWEPACGEGDISKVLEQHGLSVYSTDLVDRGYGTGGKDFLSMCTPLRYWDNIITNPPYKHATQFVNTAKIYANKKVAMFLKTVFLESEERYKLFQDKEFPLKTMYQFSKRVSLYRNGIKMKNSGMIAYAWFVWDREYTGKPQIEWIL